MLTASSRGRGLPAAGCLVPAEIRGSQAMRRPSNILTSDGGGQWSGCVCVNTSSLNTHMCKESCSHKHTHAPCHLTAPELIQQLQIHFPLVFESYLNNKKQRHGLKKQHWCSLCCRTWSTELIYSHYCARFSKADLKFRNWFSTFQAASGVFINTMKINLRRV